MELYVIYELPNLAMNYQYNQLPSEKITSPPAGREFLLSTSTALVTWFDPPRNQWSFRRVTWQKSRNVSGTFTTKNYQNFVVYVM